MSTILVCLRTRNWTFALVVHMDDMLAVGPSEVTKNLLRERHGNALGYGD